VPNSISTFAGAGGTIEYCATKGLLVGETVPARSKAGSVAEVTEHEEAVAAASTTQA
jgi:hypothetical protein